MTFPFLDDFIALRPDELCGLGGLVEFGLTGLLLFLVFDVFRHPALMSVPVTSVELEDCICSRVVAVDGIRADLLFFAGV